jgi:hypothetical protein
MKLSSCTFILLALLVAFPALAQERPTPAGIHQAEQADAQAQRDVPPPAPVPKTRLDYAQLKNDADELVTLAQSIPTGVDQISKGVLPKDLGERLKRIEKLAKHLRSQLTP